MLFIWNLDSHSSVESQSFVGDFVCRGFTDYHHHNCGPILCIYEGRAILEASLSLWIFLFHWPLCTLCPCRNLQRNGVTTRMFDNHYVVFIWDLSVQRCKTKQLLFHPCYKNNTACYPNNKAMLHPMQRERTSQGFPHITESPQRLCALYCWDSESRFVS